MCRRVDTGSQAIVSVLDRESRARTGLDLLELKLCRQGSIMSANTDLQILGKAAGELRSWGAIAIVGAGASLAAGFPLSPELQVLLWHALGADEDLVETLAGRYKRPGTTAKHLIRDDPILTQAAYEAIATNPVARRAFQHGFAQLNAERVQKPSPVHDALAELLHRRVIEIVVSLNWDTLLETAYRRRYGRTLQASGPLLCKPHGDAAFPETDWILPYEAGHIPNAIVQPVQALAIEHPRVLLIVGYSERDEEVVAKLIGPLADRWRVVRIGPDATDELSIALPADEALPALVRMVCPSPEVPGWEYVNFDNQHDLSHALAGRRLGPADVEACPRLPEVATVLKRLSVTKVAVISGKSGSGKSITAYQVAYDMCQPGWEILRLVEPEWSVEELVGAVTNLPHRSVVIVDDAQALDPAIQRSLVEMVSDQLAVIVVFTEDMPSQRDAIWIAGRRAVATLAEALRQRRDETLAIVRTLDDHVGEGYLDMPLEDRLAAAVQSSDQPWQFSFVLTGGWRRARDAVAILRDLDRADLLLAAIAARQLVSLDAGASRAWLENAVVALGRDMGWLDRTLEVLNSRRVIIGGSVLRCPHLHYSEVILRIVCKRRTDPEWSHVIKMLRAALYYDTPPLRGVSWLLSELSFADAFRGSGFGTIVDHATWLYLTERCWAANTGAERSSAAFALNALGHWSPNHVEALSSHITLLGQWLEEADADTAVGIGRLLNDLGQKEGSLTEAICDHADPTRIASSLALASLSEAYAWGWLLGRLSFAASRDWLERLTVALDTSSLRSLVTSPSTADLGGVNKLIKGVASLKLTLGVDLVKLTIPTVANAINASPAETFRPVGDMIWFVLGYAPRFLRRRGPTKRQQQVARRLARALDSTAIARSLSSSRRRDWQVYGDLLVFLREAMPRQAESIAAKIDFEALDETSEGLWAQMPPELHRLICTLAAGPDWEPARSWVNRHVAELVRLTPALAIVAPEAVVTGLRAGHSLSLGVDSGSKWSIAALALAEICEVDERLAIGVAEDNYVAMAQGFARLQASSCDGVPYFLSIMQQLAPTVLDEALMAVDATTAEQNWADRLRGKIAERRAVAALLDAVTATPGPLTPVVDRLRRHFPRASIVSYRD